MHKTVSASLFCLAFLAPSFAHADYCTGKETQFADEFTDASWAPKENVAEQKGGKYLIGLEQRASGKGEDYFEDWPDSVLFSGRFKLCVKVKTGPLNATAAMGLLFWITPKRGPAGFFNFYRATIDPAGVYSVFRFYENEYKRVVAPTKSDAIKTAAGSVNELELQMNGREGLLFINGKQVAKFSGQPPAEGYAGIGAYGGLMPDKKDGPKGTFEFSEFMIKDY